MEFMKSFKSLVNTLPKQTIVFTFGRFNPYTIGHELLVNFVKGYAKKKSYDYVVVLSNTQDKSKNPLSPQKKLYWVNKMLPNTNIRLANNTPSFIQVATELNKKYKHIVMVAGADRVEEYKTLLNKYNGTNFKFDSINVVSAGDRDPDSDDISGISASKLRKYVTDNDFESFRKGIPKILPSNEVKRYFNDIREGLGLETVVEQVKFNTTSIREQFHSGDLYKIGDIVEDNEGIYEILDIGSNYVTVINESRDTSKKWPDKIRPSSKQFNVEYFKSDVVQPDILECFNKSINEYNSGVFTDKLALINAFSNVESYYISNSINSLIKANCLLENINQLGNHPYIGELKEMKFNSADKIKVARIIAGTLGVQDVDSKSNPEQLVNDGLRKSKRMILNKDSKAIIHKMLNTAKQAGINYDETILKEELEELDELSTKVLLAYRKAASDALKKSTDKIGKRLAGADLSTKKLKALTNEDENVLNDYEISDDELIDHTFDPDKLSDDELDALIDKYLTDDDYFDAYDDDELAYVDDETGEEDVESPEDYDWSHDDHEEFKLKEQILNEVLSRAERIRSRIRMRRTKAKRQRRVKIALRRKSDMKVVNKRARRLAIKVLKKRFIKKPLNKLSVSEKERIERRIQKMGKVVDRISVRMIPKVRKLERNRLERKGFTK